MKYKVGDIIVSASSDSYVGEIIHISKEEDVVRHRCRKTGTEYEKSYFGFQCRYMTVEERLEKDQEFCTENIQLHQQILTMEREHNDAITTSKERRESIDALTAQLARREREHGALLETAQKALAHVEAERDGAKAEAERMRDERDYWERRFEYADAHLSEAFNLSPMDNLPSGEAKRIVDLLRTERDEARAKADTYERDWYEAKSEFGTAAAKLRDQVRTLEAALTTETRVALDYQKQRDEARRDLGEILAVIHRDGGHYTGEHGISKSVADAHATWAVMVRERDEARAEVEVLRRERDDLHGAVMLAEERGAEWAIRAKAQVVYSLAGDASYVMLAKEVCEQARGKR